MLDPAKTAAAVAVFLGLVVASRAQAQVPDRPGDVDAGRAAVRMLRDNEALYADIDLEWREVFELQLPPRERIGVMVAESDRSMHFVKVGAKYRYSQEGEARNARGEMFRSGFTQAFDGSVSRYADPNWANIQDTRMRIELFGKTPYRFGVGFSSDSLADYFDMDVPPLAEEGVESKKSTWAADGGSVDGLRTLRLVCTLTETKAGKLWSDYTTVAWLAVDRNYLPVKSEKYEVVPGDRGSSKIPFVKTAADDWRELRPGLWMPFRGTEDRWDGYALLKGVKVKDSHRECIVTKAVLDPRVDDSLFRDVEFSEGSMLLEIVNGKAVRTTIVGQEPGGSRSGRGGRPWAWAVATASIALLGIVGLWWRNGAGSWRRTRVPE